VKREYAAIIQRGESGVLVGTVPSVRGCFTHGKDMEELLVYVREALELCLEELGEEAEEPPEFLGVHKIVV
jgi:predicted RNase H-like HicB family nuclease